MPWTFSCQLPRAVSMSTGTLNPAARHRLKMVRPSILGKPEVEHDRVVPLGLSQKLRPLAVRRAVDRVPRLTQRTLELVGQPGFVFDDEDFHLRQRSA